MIRTGSSYPIIELLAALLICCFAQAQTFPKEKLFTPPLDSEIILAGTFGEIRTNHFHSGIDISTGGVEGKKVVAAADGYVSRINVSAVGFGKALYITHPNGYVTVYGHLQRFNDALEKYVKKEQYKRESFEVELFPSVNQFTFKQGEAIAYSGNTGGSSGPHLHFEIRDAKTEEPLDPLSSGFPLNDSLPPQINSVAIYPVHNNGKVNDSCLPLYIPVSLKQKVFSPDVKKQIILNGEIAFGIETEDIQIKNGSELGIKTIELFIDKKKVYDYSIAHFSFDESRFVNANIDYAESVASRKSIMLCYRLPGNRFSALTKDDLSGTTNFTDNNPHQILFRVYDFNNNVSQAVLNIESVPGTSACPNITPNDSTFLILYDKPFRYQSNELKLITDKFPAIYDDEYVGISKTNSDGNYLSDVFRVGDKMVAIHNSLDLSIKAKGLPDSLSSKALLVKVEPSGNVSSAGGTFSKGFVTTKIRSFGNYAVVIDTVPPEIKASNFSTQGKEAKVIFKIKISDNLSGIATYRATLNKKWMLMEYDAKTGTLTGSEAVNKKNMNYRFILVVTDKKGNRSTYKSLLKY